MNIQVEQMSEEELIALERVIKKEREKKVIDRQFAAQVKNMDEYISSHKDAVMACYMGAGGEWKIQLTPGRRDTVMTVLKGML